MKQKTEWYCPTYGKQKKNPRSFKVTWILHIVGDAYLYINLLIKILNEAFYMFLDLIPLHALQVCFVKDRGPHWMQILNLHYNTTFQKLFYVKKIF